MKKDIASRKDIEQLIEVFYEKVKADATLSFFFSEVVSINWEKHNEQMCNFWENVLFHTGNYEGNPLETHKRIDTLHKTENLHFKKWETLFFETIDSLYVGKNVNKIKQHTTAISEVMQRKI